jgi:hypothetical protein
LSTHFGKAYDGCLELLQALIFPKHGSPNAYALGCTVMPFRAVSSCV